MATITSPLLSLSARGTVAKSITYSTWKGVDYARQRIIPANPRTTAQQAQRNLFRWVHDAYKYLDPAVQASWKAYAQGKAITPANAWMTANNVALKGQADNHAIVFSKPVNSGPPTPSITATPGTGQVSITATLPTLITGWTVLEMIAIAMQSMAPSGEKEMVISKAGTKTVSPWTVVITGLTTGQMQVCGAWFSFARPDGSVAYGASINTTATPT